MFLLKEIIKNSKELSSLPEIYIRVSEILDDENSTADQIGHIVQTDPALASRLLKVVNSSFYGFPNEISTISQAVNILGRNPLRQLLTGTVLGSVFSRLSQSVFLMDDFWQHSVHTAVIAKFCYQNISKARSDELFIAGLLHSIGRLVLAHQLPEKTIEIQRILDTSERSLTSIENEQLGFNHCDVGAAIMQQWGLPTILQVCAKYHLNPADTKEFKTQVWVIHIANALAHIAITDDTNEIISLLHSLPQWEECGLDEDQVVEAYKNAYEQYQEVLNSLGL